MTSNTAAQTTTAAARWRARVAAVALPMLAVPALLSSPAAAATGDLDPTFSGDGLQTLTDGARTASASVLQSDGRLVVAGTGAYADNSPAMTGTYVARYTTGGVLDSTFGTAGVSKLSVVPGTEVVRDVTVDSAGRVLVAGYSATTDPTDEADVYVVRLTAAGLPDTTFGGGDGVAVVDLGNHDRAAGIAVSGSRILVGAAQDDAGNWANKWTLLALNSAGALDSTFSGDGKAEVPGSYDFDGLRDIALQPDGRVVLGGASGWQFVTARLTATGAVDGSWSGDGVATAAMEGSGIAYDLAVQSDKKVLLVGQATAVGRTDTDFAAARFTGAGALDGTFGGDGSVVVDLGSRLNDGAYAVGLGKDAKIVLGGFSHSSSGMDMGTARLNWNGTLDTSFSGDGLARTSTLATSNEQIESLTVGTDDRIVGTGQNLEGWSLVAHTGGANIRASVADVTITEPDSGSATATVQVTLSAPSTTPVSVAFATSNGTAVAPGDYATSKGTLKFAAGQTVKSITVAVVGDTKAEPNETVKVQLTKPTNAGVLDGDATITISNDD